MFDEQRIRRDFPILHQRVHGRPLVYLDSAATSQKPRSVIDALCRYYETYNANVHRGIHYLSELATEEYELARQKVAGFIKADGARSCIFVRNTTEAINLVAQTWGRAHVGPDDEIVLTEMEHHSNLVPWQILAHQTGAHIKLIPIREDGLLDFGLLDGLITPRTRIVALTHMSNVLGTINPVAEICELAHRKGAVVVVDGAQSVPHLPVDVQAMDCDFLAFSGHKMLGPTGIGVLYGRIEHLEAMPPFMGGGDMIREVWYDRATWNEVPYRFEAGTPNIADAIALGHAVDYLANLGMVAVRQHEQQIAAYALGRLQQLDEMTIYGPLDPARRGGVVAFNFAGIHPHDLGTILDQEGVAIRAGHHCCQPLMRKLGIVGTARASFYIYNTPDEIDVLVAALVKAKELFGSVLSR